MEDLLHLWNRRWRNSSFDLVISFKPLELLQLKGTIWTKSFESQYKILKMCQKVFHSLVICLVMFARLDVRINSKMYFAVWGFFFLINLKRKQIFMCYRRYCRVHKLISWWSFSLYLPVTVFVMPSAALYWINSGLFMKRISKCLIR